MYQKHGSGRWEDWLSKSKKLLEKSDFRGVTYLLKAYGGMGSINDDRFGKRLFWSKYIQPEEDNAKLEALLGKAYGLAICIKKSVQDKN